MLKLLASTRGNTDIVRYLVFKRAKENNKNTNGKTPYDELTLIRSSKQQET